MGIESRVLLLQSISLAKWSLLALVGVHALVFAACISKPEALDASAS
jgi:hypothetical protein